MVKQSAVREGVKRNATKPKRFDQVIDSLFVLNYSLSKLSEIIHGFLLVVTWICRNCCIDLLRLLLGFVKVVLCISCPLPNKMKFDQDFKVCRSFCFELKVLNESKHSMPLQG